MNRDLQRRSLKVSLVLHGAFLVLVFTLPWILGTCRSRRPPEKLMFVEFTVSVPPPAAPDSPEPAAPEPPAPEPAEEIKIPEKKPDPPRPKRTIKKGKRVTRRGPPPKDKTLSPEEIERLLKQGARISDVTQIPTGSQKALGAYYNHVHEKMHAAWQQPASLRNLPGLATVVAITVAPDGRVTAHRLVRGSGNDLMDSSVLQAVRSVGRLRPLPAGHRDPVEIDITFERID